MDNVGKLFTLLSPTTEAGVPDPALQPAPPALDAAKEALILQVADLKRKLLVQSAVIETRAVAKTYLDLANLVMTTPVSLSEKFTNKFS